MKAYKQTTRLFGGMTLLAALALLTTSSMAEGAKASGGGAYDSGFGVNRFGFNIQERQDGSIHGQGVFHNADLGFVAHYRYVCLEIWGNIALQVGVFTHGNGGESGLGDENGDLTGWVFMAAVEDNGEGAQAAPDQLSSTLFLPPEFVPEDLCDVLDFLVEGSDLTARDLLLGQLQLGLGFPLLEGGIQVKG